MINIKKQRAFTIIELMVSITISSFLLLVVSDFLIGMFNNKITAEVRTTNQREITLILSKIHSSLKWARYIPTETLGDMTSNQALLTDNAFGDIGEIFPALSVNGCDFKKGDAIYIPDDGSSLCIRNYLPPSSNSSIYTDKEHGKPDWVTNSDDASIQGILSCSGVSFFSSIHNSYDKYTSIVTKIFTQDAESTGKLQLACYSVPVIDSSQTLGDTATYVANSNVQIESLHFANINNSLTINLVVSSGKEILPEDCSYLDPEDISKTLTTNNRRLCTSVTRTYGLMQ